MRTSGIVLVLLAGLAACSGKVVAVDGDAGLLDGSTADAPDDADAGPSCAELSAELDKLRADARTCCPVCKSIQCAFSVQDVCCPISITADSAPAFSAAVAKFKAACPVACPAIVCPVAPSKICQAVDPGSPSSRGVCQ
jgi:hypothetical protein